MLPQDKTPTMEEIEQLISVSNEEVFIEIARADPMLVKYTAAKLQNKKMKEILIKHFGGDAPERV